MNTLKRKAERDAIDPSSDRMSSSPSPLPGTSRVGPQLSGRTVKRLRTNVTGRPLSLERLLETLRPEELRTVLRSICARHPDIGTEIKATAPRPTVASALTVLQSYQSTLRQSFPYGDRPTSEYAYNRVRPSLLELLDALRDYTPHFLPPQEQQAPTSLEYLDGATTVIHQLPNWHQFEHNRHKHEAYEEMAKAWAVVLREAAKRGGGMRIQYGGWDQKLAKHNELSGGKLQEAVSEMRSSLSWIGGPATGFDGSKTPEDPASIRQQLLSGTYGANAIQVGPW
ncbi:MAG: Tethering factor for nuclear proteasome sts1 [Chrysothrix sp. TS-e1954]|nr:MAG: Tethering factor for nuclear proteasome sts1 [Chrysothrix sp. TS-e1954]